MMRDYITVKEYAALKKISVQAVYNQLAKVDSNLIQFLIKVENGSKSQKALKIQVLSPQEREEFERLLNSTFEQSCTSFNQSESTFQSTEKQIAELKKEVERQREEIRQKDAAIADYAIRFAELAAAAQKITAQVNYIQLGAGKGTAETEQKDATAAEAPPPPPKEKKGFFRRLFKL